MAFISFLDFLKQEQENISSKIELSFEPAHISFNSDGHCVVNGYACFVVDLGTRTNTFSLQNNAIFSFPSNTVNLVDVLAVDSCEYDIEGIYDIEDACYRETQDLLNQLISIENIPNWKTTILQSMDHDMLIKMYELWKRDNT